MTFALRSSAALAAAASVLCVATAQAGSVERPLWELGVGLGLLRLPHYRGSDQAHLWVLPVPYAVYRGDILRADRDGARALLFDSDRLDLDLSLAASAPTRSEDNRAREGMPDLAPTVEVGPNLNVTLARGDHWKLDFRLPVRGVATVERQPRWLGWTATPLINLDVGRADWNLGLQAGALWGGRRLHDHFYGVGAEQEQPGRPAYAAPGGYGGWQATVALSRRFKRQWAGLFLRWDTVGGAAFADSPLVRRHQTVALGFAWSWVLAESSQRVTVADDRP